VTDPSTLVRVQAVGQALSATVHFNLVVDDRGVAADGRLTVRSGAAAFFVPAGGGVRTVNLHDLPAGVHALRADPVARPGEPPAAASSVVNFTVGPGTAGTGGHASVPFVIGLLLLGALFLLTMRRVSSYSRSLEHDEGSQPGSDDTDDGSHRGEDGEGGR
jgi:hypothetical protein